MKDRCGSVNIVITILYITLVISFNKYSLGGVLLMVPYLFIIFYISSISFLKALKESGKVIIFMFIFSFLNAFLNFENGILISSTLFLKSLLSILASYSLIKATSMNKVIRGLATLKLPKVLIYILMFIYRYIFIFIEEGERTYLAYSLRLKKGKGVKYNAWGSFLGHILLRPIDRGNEVSQSMTLRGFNGELNLQKEPLNKKDYEFLVIFGF